MKNLMRKISMVALAGTLTVPNIANATEVLTASAGDYVESIGKSLKDYTMKGIHALVEDTCYLELLKNSPGNSEVIVDYISSHFNANLEIGRICSGTALIPKE